MLDNIYSSMDYNVLYQSYDFLKTCTLALIINSPVKRLIASNGLLLTVVPIQQQKSGSNNCGLFAIAAAYHVAKGDDLGSFTLDEDKLRSHLAKC